MYMHSLRTVCTHERAGLTQSFYSSSPVTECAQLECNDPVSISVGGGDVQSHPVLERFPRVRAARCPKLEVDVTI